MDKFNVRFSLVDVDIQKPDTGYSVIERPSTLSSHQTSKGSTHAGPTPAKTPTASLSGSGRNSPVAPVVQYIEPVSEGEEDEDEIIAAKDEEDETKRTGLSSEEVKAAIAYREQMLKERREEEEEEKKRQKKAGKDRDVGPVGEIAEEVGAIGGGAPDIFDRPKYYQDASTISRKLKTSALAINPLAPSTAFDETLKTRLQGAQQLEHGFLSGRRRKKHSSRTRSRNASIPRYDDQAGENGEGKRADEIEENRALGEPSGQYVDDRILERNWKAPRGKKIAVPVRIEPKVYFAAERTFLVCLVN